MVFGVSDEIQRDVIVTQSRWLGIGLCQAVLTIIVVMGWRGMFIGCSLGLSIVRIRVLLNLHTSLFEMPAHAEAMRDGCQSNSTNISELKTTTQGDSPRAPERSSFTIKSPKE